MVKSNKVILPTGRDCDWSLESAVQWSLRFVKWSENKKDFMESSIANEMVS